MRQDPVTGAYQQPLWPDTYLWNLMGDLNTQKRPILTRSDAHKDSKVEELDKRIFNQYIEEAGDGFISSKDILQRSKIA